MEHARYVLGGSGIQNDELSQPRHTLWGCRAMTTAAAPAVTPSSSTGRWPNPPTRRRAPRATPTRSNSCPPSRSLAAVQPHRLPLPAAAGAVAVVPAAADAQRAAPQRVNLVGPGVFCTIGPPVDRSASIRGSSASRSEVLPEVPGPCFIDPGTEQRDTEVPWLKSRLRAVATRSRRSDSSELLRAMSPAGFARMVPTVRAARPPGGLSSRMPSAATTS